MDSERTDSPWSMRRFASHLKRFERLKVLLKLGVHCCHDLSHAVTIRGGEFLCSLTIVNGGRTKHTRTLNPESLVNPEPLIHSHENRPSSLKP